VLEEIFDEVENVLFVNSLMNATVQVGGKRERSVFLSNNKLLEV